MVKIINTAVQTVQPGQAVTFNQLVEKTGCGECYAPGSNSIKLRGGCNSVYTVGFGANVSSATAGTAVQLSIALGGVVIPETTAQSTPAAADTFNNIFRAIPIRLCCGDYDRITLINSGTAPITIGPNVVLFVKREG